MSQLAEFLTERISGSFDRFVPDMVARLEKRIEAELARFSNSLETALAAFLSEVINADSDRSDHDPVPGVRHASRRGLRDDESRGKGCAHSGSRDGEQPSAAQTSSEGREEGQRDLGLVEVILGPGLAAMMRPASEPSSLKRLTCSKCHEPGHNARTCGRAPVRTKLTAAKQWEVITVPPPPVRRLHPKPEALAARAEVLRARATKPPSVPVDENRNAAERWDEALIEEEAELAENRKHEGVVEVGQ